MEGKAVRTRRWCHDRRWFLLASAAITFTVVGWAYWQGPRTLITPENAATLRVGMTSAEVEATLGGPERAETSAFLAPRADLQDAELAARIQMLGRLIDKDNRDRLDGRRPLHQRWARWASNRVVVYVGFDDEGRVNYCDSFAIRPTGEGVVAAIRRWLRLEE